MTRILFITARADIGGGQECLYRLAKQTDGEAGVFIASPREEPYWSRYEDLLGKARLVEIPHRKLTLEAIKKLSAFVRDNGIQLIHSHGFGAGLYGRSVAMLTRVPVVHTFHGLVFNPSKPFWTMTRLCVEWCLSAASKSLIVVSESEAKHLKRWLFPYASRIHKIHNGIPTHQPSRGHIVSSGKPARILWVGRMCEQKDPFQVVDIAIRMRAMLPADRFTIEMVGDGPLIEELNDRVARSELGDVVLIRGSSDNIRPYYEKCDILLSTSSWEGLPTCILEAMEAGLLVVASGVPGNLDIVENLRTGLVFDKRLPLHAAQILSSVVRGGVVSENMCNAAKRRVLSAFGVERFADEHLSLYRAILHEEVMTPAI